MRSIKIRPVRQSLQPDQERALGLYLRRHGDSNPNSDTPYSFVWMDLRAEPMVLSVPAVEKTTTPQPEDGNTFNYGYIGSRATGNEAGD